MKFKVGDEVQVDRDRAVEAPWWRGHSGDAWVHETLTVIRGHENHGLPYYVLTHPSVSSLHIYSWYLKPLDQSPAAVISRALLALGLT